MSGTSSEKKGVLLVAGTDVSALAASAHKAGYSVHVVDLFGDLDVRAVADRCVSLIRQIPGRSCGHVEEVFSGEALVGLALAMAKDCSYDGVLLSSGLEDSPDALGVLQEAVPILGNSARTTARVRDKRSFFEALGSHGILHPRTYLVSSQSEAMRAAGTSGYPVLLKPRRGFGGARIRMAEDRERLAQLYHGEREVLVQEYVRGVPASISVIAAGNRSATLAVNRQLSGLQFSGSPEPFSFCGNVVPLDASRRLLAECDEVSETIVKAFGLVGSIGIDLMVDDAGRPWVIEVNPRFQGTLECVEKVLDINLVEAHVDACVKGQLPELMEMKGYCARLILYGRERCGVPDLRSFPQVRDIPVPGVVVEKGEPLCSVVVGGEESGSVLLKGFEAAEAVYSSLCRCED